ncbi:MAG: Ig-like domain-containing protein [Solirubrobacterales bacterium]
MGRRRVGRAVVLIATLVAGLSVLPETASAVLSGTNGNIVIASGRGETDDSTARLYLRRTFSGTGGPATSAPTITLGAGLGQHRHPTWSPGRTKIAYARGNNNCRPADSTNCAIYVLDLTDPNPTPQAITPANVIAKDRPAWSPDGTRIAYESEETNGSNQLDVIVDTEPFGSGLNQNLTATGTVIEGKPAWSPNSQTLYYAEGDVNVAPNGTNNDVKIFQRPATGGTATEVVHISGAHAFQPSISPDGTRICYTTSPTLGLNTMASIFVAPLNDANNATVLASSGSGDYNCTWSPDGAQIAYVRGTFASGDLVMEPADNSLLTPITLETTANRFDGNPDWAPDGRPTCEDTTATTKVNTPVQIEVPCADSGPQYERTDVGVSVSPDVAPANGTADVATGLTTTVTYTPNQGFTGTDTFQAKVRDEIAFGSDRGTVTVNVRKQLNGFEIVDVARNKKKGTAELTVSVDEGPGDLALASKKAKPVQAPVGAGENLELTLKVKAKGKAKKKLKEKGKAKVNTALTYTPDLGDPNTLNQNVKLKRKQK